MAQIYTMKKSGDRYELPPLVRHIDEWQRISADHRNQRLGQDWFDLVENFYQLTDLGGPLPSFRPLVRLPELQTIFLKEADALSEASPKVYLMDSESGSRNKERESGLQSMWRLSFLNYHAMFAMLSSLFIGMAPLQLGLDPDARNGRGAIWAKWRDPRTFYPDPTTDYTLNWSYTVAEDRLHLEEIRWRWPLTSAGLKPRTQGRMHSPAIGEAGYGFQMPEGPMSMIPGLPNNRQVPNDTRLRVRYVHCDDYTREKIEKHEIPAGAIVSPDFEWKYPNGRLIVECEGRILQDGDNPIPYKKKPYVPFWGIPPLYGIWSVPAMRFTMDMQNVAQRLYSGIFENATRLNNGVWFIDERTGIDPHDFGGIPGEVRVINANSPEPKCVYPGSMPAHFIQVPKILTDTQKELQGHGQARQGKTQAGNISPDLLDAASYAESGMTRLRGRLHAMSFQNLAELMFGLMGRYIKRQHLPLRDGKAVLWEGLLRPEQFDVVSDESAVRTLSQTVIRRMAPELLKGGALPLKEGLEAMEWPDAEKVAEGKQREMELQALGKVKGNKK